MDDSVRDEIETIRNDAKVAAEYFADKPGLTGAEAIIDLYRTIARLCAAVAKTEARP